MATSLPSLASSIARSKGPVQEVAASDFSRLSQYARSRFAENSRRISANSFCRVLGVFAEDNRLLLLLVDGVSQLSLLLISRPIQCAVVGISLDSQRASPTISSYYISQRASTSTITLVRGIFSFSASASMARNTSFSFWRLGDFKMK